MNPDSTSCGGGLWKAMRHRNVGVALNCTSNTAVAPLYWDVGRGARHSSDEHVVDPPKPPLRRRTESSSTTELV
jgi:hypothetical protein